MAGSAEMKVKATMDNSDLKKKSKESKEAMKDFAKVGEDAVSSLGNAFGVNTGKIEQMMSAVRGLGENLSKSANTGTAALGNLLKGVNGLSAGIAGISIGALVAGFKALNDEAENFKTTLAGASIESSTTAYIDTYKQIIHDYVSAVGKAGAEAEASVKKAGMTFGASFKAYFATGAYVSAFEPSIAASTQALDEYSKLIADADAKATEAARINQEIFDLQREISDSAEKWAQLELDIAENKRIAYDSTVDISKRQEALLTTIEKINERYGEEAAIQARLAKLQTDYNALASSPIEDIDKENQLKAQTLRTAAAMQDKLRELSEKQKSITAEAQKEALARKEAAEYAAQIAQSRAELAAWDGTISPTNNLTVSMPTGATALEVPGIAVSVTPEVDMEAWTVTAEDLTNMLTSYVDSMSQSLGGLVGDLINGQGAWENFGAASLSALGDLAISFGKICVASGLAAEGIKKSLSLHPVLAITAGAALIALGTAVKTSLSNIASGSYSSAGAVATSTGSYGGSSSSIGTAFDTRDITVNVKGSLRADGNQLLAVIENENTRRNHTT